MQRNELRQPLRRRGAFEKLWAKRPSALPAASLATALLLTLFAVWLLRERVTSKGGTTHAAITVLEDAGVKAAFVQALKAAQRRARELGDEFGA